MLTFPRIFISPPRPSSSRIRFPHRFSSSHHRLPPFRAPSSSCIPSHRFPSSVLVLTFRAPLSSCIPSHRFPSFLSHFQSTFIFLHPFPPISFIRLTQF